MKILITGSPDFTDYAIVKTKMDSFTRKLKRVTVISGGRSMSAGATIFGADYFGEFWAFERFRKCPTVDIYHLNPHKTKHSQEEHDKHNRILLKKCDAVVFFIEEPIDNKTRDILELAKKIRKPFRKVTI
jgi:hypothetical protein